MEIQFEKEGRDKLIDGINKLCKAVSSTLGPNGKTVIIPDSDNYGEYKITKDGVSVANSIIFKDPVENIGASLIKKVAQLTVDQAGDGPQPLYAKVLTPNGFVKMSDLKINDEICGTNQTIQKVVGIYPKGKLKVYKLKFNNGQVVECSENHIWNVNTYYDKNKNLTTKDLINNTFKSLNKDGSNKYHYYIPNTIVEFSKKEQILDPFLVGLLLGDGSLCKTGSIELSLALDQKYILDKIILPKGIKMSYTENLIKHYLRVKFSRIKNSGPTMHDYIEKLGLLNCKSNNKFIPDNYKYSDYNSRLKLLEGLSETDGHINKRGLLEYNTISEKLFNDVKELLSGLGKQSFGYLMKRKSDSSYSDTSIYRISELKGYKNGIKLIDIEETDLTEEMMCIKVSNADSLYITNDYITTHNTSTSIVLATAFVNNLKDFNSNDINKAFDEIIPKVIQSLKDNSRQLKQEDIKYVATISANNDSKIGEVIQDAYNFSSIIKVEEGGDIDSLECVEGMSLPVSYISKKFITDHKKAECEQDEPYVLVLDGKLENLNAFEQPIKEIASKSDKLLIITEHVHENVLRLLEGNFLKGSLNVCVIKAPGYSKHRKDLLKDIADFTGASVINDFNKQYNMSILGRLKSSKITKTTSILVKHDSINIEDNIENLKSQFINSLDAHDKSLLEQRINNLTGKVATIKVGGRSDIEMKERKDRYDDAVLAVACALEEGIVEGGGIALFKARDILLNDLEIESTIGRFLLRSICYPWSTIKENQDYSFKDVEGVQKLFKEAREINMFDLNIIDPLKVTRCALENAVSVAKTILSTEAIVINHNEWMK